MRKCIAVLIIAVFAVTILSEPLRALTTWSSPGSNPTTIPAGKAVMLFKGLSEVQKLKIACAIATTPSSPTFVLPGEQFSEMTEGNSTAKSFVAVGGIDTLWGQCWVVDGIELVQFVACNNLAWRPTYVPQSNPKGTVTETPASPQFTPPTITDVFRNVPFPFSLALLPGAALYSLGHAIGSFLFGSNEVPPPGSGN